MANVGRPSILTDEVEESICSSIRRGSFPWVAAEAAGIAHRTFDRWMTAGQRARRGRHYGFWRAVRQAAAEAQSQAERRVFTDHPELWLTKGPGRSRFDEDGWTEQYDVNLTQADTLKIIVEYENDPLLRDPYAERLANGVGPKHE